MGARTGEERRGELDGEEEEGGKRRGGSRGVEGGEEWMDRAGERA